MNEQKIHVVTGAFGFSGKYITRRLLEEGQVVRTLTHSVARRHPFGSKVRVYPYDFDNPEKLAGSLAGAHILYNTYWVRFNSERFSFVSALENTKTLFKAAKQAGIERIVQISITNPSKDSPLEYFRGKAEIERSLAESGFSHAILRPAVLFGKGGILIDNIAWILRRFPVFGIFGNGKYRLQPIYVDDLAGLAVEMGKVRENRTIDAIGPETFTYEELVRTIGRIIGKERPIVSMPPILGYAASKIIGFSVGDVLITRDEIKGLTAGLLHVDAPPAGKTRLTDWVLANSESIGRNYSSELARRTDRLNAYTALENSHHKRQRG
jgi:NADH dehydrogenase